jgi:acyl carrier protein/thioesterase domain-containing protein
VLGMVKNTAGSAVDADAPLMEAGVDSLGAVELRSQLQACIHGGATLPTQLIFEHPTSRQLTKALQATSANEHIGAPPSVRASPPQPIVPSGACVVLELPGFDGSFFHLKALDACFEQLAIEHLHLKGTSADSDPVSDAASSLNLLRPSSNMSITLLGYSAGCYAVHRLVHGLQTLDFRVGAMILVDPAFRSSANVRDAGVRLIATSVLDVVPDDLDPLLLEEALVEVFPTYAARFEAARNLSLVAEAEPLFEAEVDPTISVLLLISTEEHEVMSAFTGGAPAEAEWSQRFPHATVMHVKSDHLTIPYTPETAWCIVQFLGSVCGCKFSNDALRAGQQRFTETNDVMEATRQSFRRAWKSSVYANEEFRLQGSHAAAHSQGRLRNSSSTIKCGPRHMSLFEVEEMVRRHTAVQDVLAFGASHRRDGEVVCVAVVARSGHTVSLRELRTHANSLPKQLLPEALVIVREMPKGRHVRIGLSARLGLPALPADHDTWDMCATGVCEPLQTGRPVQHGGAQGEARVTMSFEALLANVLGAVQKRTREDVEADQPLVDAGLDSLSATLLADELGRTTGVSLPPTLVFQYGTAKAIADHLRAKLEPSASMLDSRPSVRSDKSNRSVHISGAGSRWPCGLTTQNELALLVGTACDASGQVPINRWPVGHVDTRQAAVRYAICLTGVELFDARKFAIAPAEVLIVRLQPMTPFVSQVAVSLDVLAP